MSRGGRRPNTGRPKGMLNKKSAENIKRAEETGEMPHEFLLRLARDQLTEQEKLINGIQNVPLNIRLQAAKDCAPYFAPKLAQIEKTIEKTVRSVISAEPLTPEQWEDKYSIQDVEH